MVWSLHFTLAAPYETEDYYFFICTEGSKLSIRRRKRSKGIQNLQQRHWHNYSDAHAPSHRYTDSYTLVRKEEAAWICQARVSGLIIWEIWWVKQILKCAFFPHSFFFFFLWPWRPWISCDATFPLGCFFQHMGLCALGLATFLTMQAIKFLSPLLWGTDYYSTFSSPFKRMLKLLAVSIGRVSVVGSPAVLQIH